MDFMNRAAARRQAFHTASRAWLVSAALALLAMMSLGWSSQALAQSCDFVTINDIDAINPANTQVSFVLEAQTACSPTVNVALATLNPRDRQITSKKLNRYFFTYWFYRGRRS